MSFVDSRAVAALASDPAKRLTMILVRCGSCRFIAPAQDVAHIIAALEAAGDYARDASIWKGGN